MRRPKPLPTTPPTYPDAFNRDATAQQQVYNLINEWNITTVIETGTYMGDTTRYLADIAGQVHTIECNADYYNVISKKLEAIKNITCHFGSSPEVLAKILPTVKQRLFIFLDAHWYANWPILNELRIISAHTIEQPVIMIHDIYNPHNPECGFDTYNNQRLDFEFIKPGLDMIYGADNYNLRYNADGPRGILYVLPK